MSHYTPLRLPYSAPADQLPAPLPSFDEIISSKNEFIWYVNDARHVVQVGDHFIVKWGTRVNLIEAENMLFVQRNCPGVSIPKLYAVYQRQHQIRGDGDVPLVVTVNVIVMEYIRGDSLARQINHLGKGQGRAITRSLRAQLAALRSAPQESRPAYYGALGRAPFRNDFWSRASGPFSSARAYLTALFALECQAGRAHPEVAVPGWAASRVSFVALMTRKSRAGLPGHGGPVFTHADLHPGNVVLRRRNGGGGGGGGDDAFEPFIVDWESAGWHAPFWEYTATCTELEALGPRWSAMARRLLDDYSEEQGILGRVREIWALRVGE